MKRRMKRYRNGIARQGSLAHVPPVVQFLRLQQKDLNLPMADGLMKLVQVGYDHAEDECKKDLLQ